MISLGQILDKIVSSVKPKIGLEDQKRGISPAVGQSPAGSDTDYPVTQDISKHRGAKVKRVAHEAPPEGRNTDSPITLNISNHRVKVNADQSEQ